MTAPGGGLTPPSGELRVVDDVPAAFVEVVRATVSETAPGSRRTTLALSGGETARRCYERLSRAESIDWQSVECYLGDERCVPPDDPDANERLVREALVDRVPLGAFHPMDCARPEEYETLVAAAEPLDLVHLGLGPDGHTASLFPGSRALESPPGRLVVHNVDPSGRNKHERLSFTFEAINRSRLALFTVEGAGKQEALHGILTGEDLPAARVRAARVIWLCDRDALGKDLGRVR